MKQYSYFTGFSVTRLYSQIRLYLSLINPLKRMNKKLKNERITEWHSHNSFSHMKNKYSKRLEKTLLYRKIPAIHLLFSWIRNLDVQHKKFCCNYFVRPCFYKQIYSKMFQIFFECLPFLDTKQKLNLHKTFRRSPGQTLHKNEVFH